MGRLPSNTLAVRTLEASPSGAPRNVVVRMMNMTTMRVSWRPPKPELLNGILRGYRIIIKGNESRYHKNITTEENASSVILFKLIPGMTYHIQVAAYTNGGVGLVHGEDIVTMDKKTLGVHLTLNEKDFRSGQDTVGKIVKQPWFIAVVGVIAWLIIMILFIYGCWRCRGIGMKKGSFGMPFVKINDGINRDTLWMDSYPPVVRDNGSLRAGTTINGNILLNDLTVNTSPGPPSYYEAQKYGVRESAYGDRSESAYMQMSQQNLTTFHRGRPESPTPYATTTLAMAGRKPVTQIYNEPSGIYDLRAQSSSTSQLQKAGLHHVHPLGMAYPHPHEGNFSRRPKNSSGKIDPSPPHTECSFIPSSDGNSGSSAGSKDFGHNQVSPCPPHLLDFIPPPPEQPPPSDIGTPPDLSPELLRHMSSTLDRRQPRDRDQGMRQHYHPNPTLRQKPPPHGGVPFGVPQQYVDPSSAPLERRLRHTQLSAAQENHHMNELLNSFRSNIPHRSNGHSGSENGVRLFLIFFTFFLTKGLSDCHAITEFRRGTDVSV